MKKILFLLFLAFIQTAYSDDSITSKIVIYRDNNFQGAAVAYKTFVNDSVVVKLRNNSFYSYNCRPGLYVIQIANFDETRLHLNVEEGKIYYCRFGLRSGFWTSYPELILVDSVSAYPAIISGKMHELDGTPIIRPKHRIGIEMFMGGGFDNIPMITTVNNNDSKISFGGGFGFGLKYGYEINKHIDLALGFKYQVSDLIPYLNNATITVERSVLSFTPSYIVPISGGDAMRIKFGVGLDKYFSSVLSADTRNLSNGFLLDWKYKSDLGYHLSAIFELNASDNWSLNYGLNWYKSSFKFNSGGISYPTDSRLINPNGSGLDLILGIFYHF